MDQNKKWEDDWDEEDDGTRFILASIGGDFNRSHIGVMREWEDDESTPYIYGEIWIDEEQHKGTVYTRMQLDELIDHNNDSDERKQWNKLKERLDHLMYIVVEKKIHQCGRAKSTIADSDFYHN